MWSLACLLLFLQDPLPKFADAWAIGATGSRGRDSIPTDALEALRAHGTLTRPGEGSTVQLADGKTRAWRVVQFDQSGKLDVPEARGGHVFALVTSDRERVVLLHASGHRAVFVDGEPRAGDLYNSGFVKVPVLLRKGETGFLFGCGRGALHASFLPAPEAIDWSMDDSTLPELWVGDAEPALGAVLVVNPTPRDALATLHARLGGTESTDDMAPRWLPPMSVTKVPFRFRGPAPRQAGTAELTLSLNAGPPRPLQLTVHAAGDGGRHTFLSAIDDSVQYFATNPARTRPGDPAPALVLSLHGAGVDASGQAGSYAPKTWATIVAPTNRRPFGFDWEDWGAWDALEVLDLAQRTFAMDPTRTCLTGHSMGGHGTWQIGGLFPDRFAAVGPSAGWISFFTYGNGAVPEPGDGVPALFRRARATCDTLQFARNHAQHAVYVLHGDQDDNVPITQARTMREHLAAFHRDLHWHEQPGAGHWWSDSDEPGAACVDWPPLFDLFAARRIPAPREVRDVEFVTLNPALSARCRWLTVAQQEQSLLPSTVKVRFDPGRRRFTGTTANVRRLQFDLRALGGEGPAKAVLDGTILDAVAPATDGQLHLARRDGAWQASPPLAAAEKGPHRAGPFKHAFRNHVLLVFGTHGTPEENAWALAKARFDAEGFWYRGNSSLELLPDTRFDPKAAPDRNVVLYGHVEMNSAWPALFGQSPVQVRRGVAVVGDRSFPGDDLACLAVHPRPGSDVALVGVVAGTGMPGLRATDRMPYLVSGTGFPDAVVFTAGMWRTGMAGVRAAGFYGPGWAIQGGDFAFAKE